ncbi:MAG: hypothetical protein KF804_15280 [Burkholderiales bacterium]|nr:hypothetical protein [Burkholderiales bacterium]
MSQARWSFWIDVEGFSTIYRDNDGHALQAIGLLMEAIYKIGSTIYSKAPDRFFVHQFGDGFVVVSDFPESSAERPVAIAISLMRHLIASGVACKVSVSCGGFADVAGFYPRAVSDQSTDGYRVPIGEGLMTIIPVMGTALIASHKLAEKRKGAVLILDNTCFKFVPKELIIRKANPSTVDWVHSNSELAGRISIAAGLSFLDSLATETSLRAYLDANKGGVTDEWIASTVECNGLAQ